MGSKSYSPSQNQSDLIKGKTLERDKTLKNYTDFGLFLRAGIGMDGGWRMGDCGGEELLPGSVGGRGRSLSDGRLRTSFSFLDERWGGVDFFGLVA